ncbi:MAG: hypothetical protein ABSA16_05995 [Thermoguttaceae bacterium]|jgi:hypothetical protein
MKKTQSSKLPGRAEDMGTECNFDYQKARPNRFAGRGGKNSIVIVLDADVSKIFSTSKSVNTVLRALIAAMPKKPK